MWIYIKKNSFSSDMFNLCFMSKWKLAYLSRLNKSPFFTFFFLLLNSKEIFILYIIL